MGSAEKQGITSWETLSEENNEVSQENDNQAIKTTRKRSYECTYCKRGFTNAQALGGHMNIHRKDRAKAKQHRNNYQKDHHQDMSGFAVNDVDSSRFSSPANWYHQIEYNHHHRGVYFQPSSGPSVGNTFSYKTPNQFANGELGMGADLGSHVDSERYLGRGGDDARPESSNREDLDLELRLGHGYY